MSIKEFSDKSNLASSKGDRSSFSLLNSIFVLLNKFSLAKFNEVIALMNRDELLKRYAAGERDFSGVDLGRANLYGIDLSSANLSRANISYAKLSDANLQSTDLCQADLSDTDLSYANLSYANLSDANLTGAELDGAELSNINLSRANLQEPIPLIKSFESIYG
ncbi:MAG: pentapeptide repeat-containing protein [Nostoc sp. DedSLP03]|uniref:pentapeptide repeat-containing protein n=1 Tax=Nostoc sp. DedSLP03 TaxID=3075400 RepID=UPI002AD39C0A|nr:pentapeptide repeat-containing protein [Nostoc sp. DedSLP03]MDZ7964838.1 pentapeptide repeat-containing protein [Nostoc sp. DedSLP03]